MSNSNIWVFIDHSKSGISSVSYELITAAKDLASKSNQKAYGILIGYQLDEKLQQVCKYGLDKIIVIDDAKLQYETAENYTSIMIDFFKNNPPSVILGVCNEWYRQLFARISVQLKTGVGSDCVDLDYKNNQLVMKRSLYGGNIESNVAIPVELTQMATLRPCVFKRAPMIETVSAVENIQVDESLLLSGGVEVLEEKDTSNEIKLTEAEIIVSGGRGLGGSESFSVIQQLCDVLGGALGASRAAVDAGWIAYKHQVGQTGQTVQPKIYFACGISGAIQHLVGMQTSDIIVAINKDKDCTMMKIANYSLEGDLFKIVPILTERFKEILGK